MDKWQSKDLYQHPAPHCKGTYGQVCLTGAGIYYLRMGTPYRMGSSVIGCPQDWASKIHVEENITILHEACEAEGTPFEVINLAKE